MKNRLLRISMAAALALGVGSVVAVAAAPSGAAAPAQKCTHLTGSATLSPGINNTARTQTAKATGKLTGCTPASGKTGGSGTLSATLKITKGNCTNLAKGGQHFTGNAKTVWKNKKTSTYALTFTTGKGKTATVATITGHVSAGLFAGHKVTGGVKFTVKKGQNCLTVPVKNLTFVQSKAFQIA
jgi:hypothetical protein